MSKKPCSWCFEKDAISGEEYCARCKKMTIDDKVESVKVRRGNRDSDKRENCRETKSGSGHG